MSWWSAIAALGGEALGGMFGMEGQRDANRANRLLARENRDWMERMSNTEIQRRMADLEAAGVNPALAFMSGGASTPSPPVAEMRNEGAAMGQAVSRGVTSAIAAAQLKVAEAQARKTNAEAALVEAEVPWSAQNAQQRSEKLFSESRVAAQEIGLKEIEAAVKKRDMEELQPLLIQMRAALVRAEQLGLSEKEAISKLYREFENAKGFERIVPLILSILRGAHAWSSK